MAIGRKRKSTTEAGDAVAAEEARQEQREAKGSNSRKGEAEIQAAHESLNRLEGVLETARGKVRQKWKDLKEEGYNIGALKRARKDLRADPLEAQMELDDYLAYRDMLGAGDALQAARQAEENEANAASVSAAERARSGKKPQPMATAESLAKANQEGVAAGGSNRHRDENPYAEGSPEFLKWDAGWVGAQRQIAAAMNGSTEGAPAIA